MVPVLPYWYRYPGPALAFSLQHWCGTGNNLIRNVATKNPGRLRSRLRFSFKKLGPSKMIRITNSLDCFTCISAAEHWFVFQTIGGSTWTSPRVCPASSGRAKVAWRSWVMIGVSRSEGPDPGQVLPDRKLIRHGSETFRHV